VIKFLMRLKYIIFKTIENFVKLRKRLQGGM
jgi:hypothetical protein